MARLLLDENLSERLIVALREFFPGSDHVRNLGLARADDSAVWRYARDAGMTIMSKDSDFQQMSSLHGHPPKVIWLRLGNMTTDQTIDVVLRRRGAILDFADDAGKALLIVGD
jgi:predicted nuclease of predicted toxin-antitoxin system